eukprot:762286-Pleurochrysis_carterae.AAC.1
MFARGTAVWWIEVLSKDERHMKQEVIERGVDAVVEPDDSQRGAVSSESTRGGESLQRHDGGLGVDARWVIGIDGHRAFVGAQRDKTVYPVT